jgi:hypothetical protein
MRTSVKHTATRLSIAAAACALVIAGSGCATGFITSPPTNVTDTAATLQGSVGSNLNTDGTYWFEYGETKDYGHSTPHQQVTFTSNVKQPVSETVKGLSGWNDYHYRLCADDSDPQAPGPHCSGDEKFTTPDPQITLGPDRPRYTLHIAAGDGSSGATQSGIASLNVDVDGTPVDNPPDTPGCPADNCSVDEDWTFDAADYSPGHHTVTVTATDRVGRPTSKTLDVDIEADSTKPSLRASGPLASAPEGWVDQKSYTVTAESADSGYGVTSVKLLVDDQIVGQPATQTCADGGCSLNHTFTVNTANYAGGAHDVKLVATDGAANDATKSWTMNVNPDGNISAGEAAETVKAADATADATVLAPTSEVVDPVEIAAGNNPGLEQSGTSLTSSGTPAPTSMTTDPADGFTIQAPNDTIHVTPVQTSSSATDAGVKSGAAAVSGDTSNQVDTVVRPIFDGMMTFESIRDATSPETFSWKVSLDTDQRLQSVDPQHAEVYWDDGTPAMMITAEPAHDATGTNVPTTLAVTSPNVITLSVAHHGSSFVYPITAGPGWETAYVVETPGPDEGPGMNISAPDLGRPVTGQPHGCDHPVTQSSAPCRWAVVSCLDKDLIPHVGACHTDVSDTHLWTGVVRGKFKFNGRPGHDGGAAWVPDYMQGDPSNLSCSSRAIYTGMGVSCRRAFWRGPNPAPYHLKNAQYMELFGVFDTYDKDCDILGPLVPTPCVPHNKAYALRSMVFGDGYVSHSHLYYWDGS